MTTTMITGADTDDVAVLDDEQLEVRICTLASRLAAAMCQFLLAVAEYDRRESWAAWECRSMVHWLSWKCGVSPITARHQVVVAKALTGLPLVRERFGRGELSYSQVRAITRVATEANEAQLVELARAMTASQLEAVTRAYRHTTAVGAAQADARDRRRQLSWGWSDDGMLEGRFCLPPEQGALLLKALEKLWSAHPAGDGDEADQALNPPGAAAADVLVEMAERALADEGRAEGSAGERFLVTVITDAEVLSGDAEGCCYLADGPGLSAQTARRLSCDSSTVTIVEDHHGGVLNVGRRTRRVSQALRRALGRRDGQCRFPGCDNRRTEAHHIRHWSQGGQTCLDNLVSLCPRHHHRHHEGGFRIERTTDGQLCFYRADGRLLPAVATPLTPVDAWALNANVDTWACQPDWDGSRPDLGLIVDGLLQTDGHLEYATAPAA